MEAINDHSNIIICGETGCGKTTQVPQVSMMLEYDDIFYDSNLAYHLIMPFLPSKIYQFLYEAGYGSIKSHVHSGIVGVTQPRRVAVLATAKRVAYELGLRLGKEVGFQVRYDKRIGDNCSIKFMTDGILLREVQVVIFPHYFSICSFIEVLSSLKLCKHLFTLW